MTPVSALLPVHRDGDALPGALGDLLGQTEPPAEILLILNGTDETTRRVARLLAERHKTVRVIELDEAGLARALNAGLKEASHDLVMRMDADDRCHADRLRLQRAWMESRPGAGGVASAYDVLDATGARAFTVRPPEDPREMRWRLVLGNIVAHGSVMLRRTVVRALGGYDESLARAQDYDLWLRLTRAHDLGSVPQILYTHKTRHADDASRVTPQQGAIAAEKMLGAWRSLPGDAEDGVLQPILSDLLSRPRDPRDALAAIESRLNLHGPTRESLLAWLWARWITPPANHGAAMVARRALVREVSARVRNLGARRVWLYGAGVHTASLLEHPEDLGVPVAGVVDDARAGETIAGFTIATPGTIASGEHVLLSSDWHEDELWAGSAPLRARGVMVYRVYGGDAGA